MLTELCTTIENRKGVAGDQDEIRFEFHHSLQGAVEYLESFGCVTEPVVSAVLFRPGIEIDQ